MGGRTRTLARPHRPLLSPQVGSALIFAGGPAFAPLLAGTHWAVEGAAAWRADGAARYGRLGSALAVADWDADGQADVVLGAPRASAAIPAAGAADPVEMPGAVYVYKAAF